MEKAYFEGKIFDKIATDSSPLIAGDYEDCQFINCDLSRANLSSMHFSECLFTGCNLSMANLAGTTLGDVKFKDCKLHGIQFENCNRIIFTVSFVGCTLNFSSFYQLKMKKTVFSDCSLQEVDFTECDLTASVFNNCDFMNAKFERTILEKADLRTSFNYTLNPEINSIRKAKFSQAGVTGLLLKYDIQIE